MGKRRGGGLLRSSIHQSGRRCSRSNDTVECSACRGCGTAINLIRVYGSPATRPAHSYTSAMFLLPRPSARASAKPRLVVVVVGRTHRIRLTPSNSTPYCFGGVGALRGPCLISSKSYYSIRLSSTRAQFLRRVYLFVFLSFPCHGRFSSDPRRFQKPCFAIFSRSTWFRSTTSSTRLKIYTY